MGIFKKWYEDQKVRSENGALYGSISKQLVADGKEHILMKGVVVISNKELEKLQEAMANNGFEVKSLDIQEHPNRRMKMLKIVYQSR